MTFLIFGGTAASLVWCFRVRRRFVQSHQPVARRPLPQIWPWLDWRTCARLAQREDRRAAAFCLLFAGAILTIVVGIGLSLVR